MLKKSELYNSGLGNPPNWTNVSSNDSNSHLLYIEALNWANIVFDFDDLKKETIKWLELNNRKIEGIDLVEDFKFRSVGKLCWILNEGGFIEDKEWFNEKLNDLILLAQKKAQEKNNSPMSEMSEKLPQLTYIYTYNELDDLYDSGNWDEDQILNILKKYVQTHQSLALLKERCGTILNELGGAKREFKEYFQNISDQEIDLSRRFYRQILLLVDNFVANKKARRKPKKVNATRKIQRAIKNVKFKKEDSNYKLVSIDPAMVVGATALMIFNTKSRRIGLYIAENGKTLSMKGTSVQNYDEKVSGGKTLRKPEEQLNHFRTATFKRAEILLRDHVAGKLHLLNGRLNADTVLLKKF